MSTVHRNISIHSLPKHPAQENLSSSFTTPRSVYNFIHSNPTWSLQSLYDYCMTYIPGCTRTIFSSCCKEYIDSTHFKSLKIVEES